MAFPASLTEPLEVLEESFYLPDPKRRWWRHRAHRLELVKRARQVGKAWRDLKASLAAAGAPEAPWPITVDPYATFEEESNRFQRDAFSGRSKLVMGSWDTPLWNLDLPEDQIPLGCIVTLLHEQAHARLSNRLSGWVESLPAELRFHMDWAWEQAPGHPGRRAFHEMYADASAATWVLLIGKHAPDARALVQALADFRQRDLADAKASNVFSPYDTAGVVNAVLALPAEALEQTPEEHVQRLTVDAFRTWLDQGGRQECDAFVDTYSQLPLHKMFLMAMAGCLPIFQRFGESDRYYYGLVKLAKELPDHPILRFNQSQFALAHGEPLGQ